MLTEKEARKICETLLKMTKAEDAVVSVNESLDSNQRFAANGFTTNGSSRDRQFSVTVWMNKRQGSSSGTEFDPTSLRRAVEQAESIAKLSPVDVEYVPTLGPQKYRPVKGFVEDTAEISPKWRARQISSILDRCDGARVVGAGLLRSGAFSGGSATRNGNFEFERSTIASLSMTARTPDGTSSGYALHSHFDSDKLDVKGVAERAIKKAREGAAAQIIRPGVYPVILEPQAAGDLLGYFSRSTFIARTAEEGRGPLSAPGGKTRLGEAVFDSKINLYSDPWHPDLPGSQSAQEGLPAEKIHLIRNGVVENLIYSRFWAQKTGKQPTPGPVNQILDTSGKMHSLEEMIAEMKRGLLITRLWYIRMVDPRTQALTGLTRDGVWLVENGKIKQPVRNFRFNQSMLQMLAPGNVEMVGKPERVGGGRGAEGVSLCPALKLKSFNFSSASEAV
jgi:predicted Zn-dependent protease